MFGTIVRASNSYLTDNKGSVIGISIRESKFNDMTILNKFKRIVAINLSDNDIHDINISNLPDLRFIKIFEDNEYRKYQCYFNYSVHTGLYWTCRSNAF